MSKCCVFRSLQRWRRKSTRSVQVSKAVVDFPSGIIRSLLTNVAVYKVHSF